MTATPPRFNENDLAFATKFAELAKLTCNEPPSIDDGENEGDVLMVGFFRIALVEDFREVVSVLGTVNRRYVAFVVTVEMVMHTFDDDCFHEDMEISREDNLAAALKACSLEEKGWELDAIIEIAAELIKSPEEEC